MTRHVGGLRFARAIERPAGVPQGRPRGAKAAGLRYERALAASMPAAKHGVWFEFEDSRGRGLCQTDLLFPYAGVCYILEAKYTWTLAGHEQIEHLYVPVVSKALGRRVFGIVVCRRLIAGMPTGVVICCDVYSAMREAQAGSRTVWHWLGTPALAAA